MCFHGKRYVLTSAVALPNHVSWVPLWYAIQSGARHALEAHDNQGAPIVTVLVGLTTRLVNLPVKCMVGQNCVVTPPNPTWT